MGKPNTPGGDEAAGIDAAVGSVDGVIVAAEPEAITASPEAKAIVGRSPGQIAWIRLKRDRTAMVSLAALTFFVALALLAPVVQWLYGGAPEAGNGDDLDLSGLPLGYVGGVSGEHWLGVLPQRGQDLLLQLVFGIRTSLGIAVVSSIISTMIGVIIGVVAGYARGWLDKVLSWFIDVMLAFPFFLFALAVLPTLSTRMQDEFGAVAVWKRIMVIMSVFVLFGWIYTARIIRGQVISLREREYVEAARAAGAGVGHILFKQLLPNLWAPILVTFSLGVPATITAEAALSIFGIGLTEGDGIASLGRLVGYSVNWIPRSELAPGTAWLPGITLFAIVLAFNLFGDSLRDALDPKSQR